MKECFLDNCSNKTFGTIRLESGGDDIPLCKECFDEWNKNGFVQTKPRPRETKKD